MVDELEHSVDEIDHSNEPDLNPENQANKLGNKGEWIFLGVRFAAAAAIMSNFGPGDILSPTASAGILLAPQLARKSIDIGVGIKNKAIDTVVNSPNRIFKKAALGWVHLGINLLRNRRNEDSIPQLTDDQPTAIEDSRDLILQELNRIVDEGIAEPDQNIPEYINAPILDIENPELNDEIDTSNQLNNLLAKRRDSRRTTQAMSVPENLVYKNPATQPTKILSPRRRGA